MMTYRLGIGTLSGYSFKGTDDDAWQSLVEAVEVLRHNPERIMDEARRLGAGEQCEHGCCTLEDLAKAYQKNDDATLVLYPQERIVRQFATGSERALKEHVRRAFCRLIIEDMHRLGVEIELLVC